VHIRGGVRVGGFGQLALLDRGGKRVQGEKSPEPGLLHRVAEDAGVHLSVRGHALRRADRLEASATRAHWHFWR